MARMRSPDGAEVVEVPDDLVAHYEGLGAILEAAPGAAGSRVPVATRKGLPITEFPGEDEPLEANPLLSPELLAGLPVGRAGLALSGLGARAVGRGAAALGRAGSRIVGEFSEAPVLRHLPGASKVRNMAEDVGNLLARPRDPAAEAIGSALRRVRSSGAARMPGRGTATPAPTAAAAPDVPRETSKIAGEIKPRTKPVRPKKAKKPEKGTAESRVAAEDPNARVREVQSPEGGVRHNVQYFSESRGQFVNIEDMHISQLRNAMNKIQRKLSKFKNPAKRSPITNETLEAMKREVEHRFREAGSLTIPPELGSAASRVAKKAAG